MHSSGSSNSNVPIESLRPKRSTASHHLLNISVLGGCEAFFSTETPISFSTKKNLALLVYLAMSAGKHQSREKLATLLWGRSAESQARSSLRQALSKLCRELNPESVKNLIVTRSAVCLKIPDHQVDALRFRHLAVQGTPAALEKAVKLYRGDFLAGFNIREDAFFEWKVSHRQHLHETALGLFRKLISHHLNAGDAEAVIQTAERSLDLDPIQGYVHRTLMRLYAEQGRRESAIRQYDYCCEVFRRELDIEPDKETQRLAKQILDQELTGAAPEMSGQLIADDSDAAGTVASSRALTNPAPTLFGSTLRQVTVLICNLAGMDTLVTQLDAEELGTVLEKYQSCCEHVVERFQGRIWHYTGDQILICFGCHRIYEKDPERAVRAALELITSVKKISVWSESSLRICIGIATGKVMITNLPREHDDRKQTIAGEAVYLAAQLNKIAGPDGILIEGSTSQLVGTLFRYQELGDQTYGDTGKSIKVWRVIGEKGMDARFSSARTFVPLTPLFGRKEEVEILQRRWRHVLKGKGQLVLLMGEPGIGKSRLALTMRQELVTSAEFQMVLFCSPFYRNTPLAPVIELVERMAGFRTKDTDTIKLNKLAALLGADTVNTWKPLSLIASLLSIPVAHHNPDQNPDKHERKVKTFEILLTQLCKLAERQPLLIICEDLQWADPSFLRFLAEVIDRMGDLPIFIIATSRPGFSPAWIGRPNVTTLILNQLDHASSLLIATKAAADTRLPSSTLEQIAEKSDGVPLFIEELTKTALSSAGRSKNADSFAMESIPVSNTLHDCLLSRIDQLDSAAEEVVRLAAVLGRRFPFRVLAEVSLLDQAALRGVLLKLVGAELMNCHGEPPEAEYAFRHALVRDAVYQSLLHKTRERLHQRIANTLESRFSEIVKTEPELLTYPSR